MEESFAVATEQEGQPVEVVAYAEGLAFAPGDPVIDSVRRFGVYTLLTSTGSFDTGRAITRPAVLTTLRRAARKVRIDTRC